MDQKPVEAVLKRKRIEEIVNPRMVQAPSAVSVRRAVEIMQEHKAGYVILADNRKIAGIFTEVDLVRKVLGFPVNWEEPVAGFMTAKPTCLKPGDLVKRAVEIMSEHRSYHIPLVDDQGDLTGVLSVRTLIRFLAEFYPTEIYNLPPDPDQVMDTPEGG